MAISNSVFAQHGRQRLLTAFKTFAWAIMNFDQNEIASPNVAWVDFKLNVVAVNGSELRDGV